MGHRQNRQPLVLFVRLERMVRRKNVVYQVAVAEHDSLCFAGSARGIDQGGEVVGIGFSRAAVTGKGVVIAAYDRKRVEVIHERHTLKAILWHLGRKFAADEEHLCLGMLQNIAHFVFGTVRQYGNDNTAECHR